MLNQNLYASPPIAKMRGYSGKCKYSVVGKFISVKNTGVQQVPALEPDTDFMQFQFDLANNDYDKLYNAMEEVSILCAEPIVPSSNLNLMAPTNDFMNDIYGEQVLVNYITFYTIHTLSKGHFATEGEVVTAQEVNDEIKDSLSTLNYGFNQGGMRFTSMAGHQPNWFNPKISVNSVDIFKSLDRTVQFNTAEFGQPEILVKNHKAAFSSGLQLPFDYYPNKIVEHFESIEVKASCYQIIDIPIGDSGRTKTRYYQRVPLLCEIDFIVL